MSKANNRSNTDMEESGLIYRPDNFHITVTTRYKKRPCLRCGKKFSSKGPYNRICTRCDLINTRIGVNSYPLKLRNAEIKDYFENVKVSPVKYMKIEYE